MVRRRTRLFSCAVVAALGMIGAARTAGAPPVKAPAQAGVAYEIKLDTTIDPGSERWVHDSLDKARSAGAKLVIIELDTPGGLADSMRSIVKRIIASPLPVVVYVAPNGARAASAGLYITEAADVAAMAPLTNIGSATPIEIGPGGASDVLGHKIENDAAAYVAALAQGHGRNPSLAERMVHEATNVDAARAKTSGLIDVIAGSDSELLQRLDGFHVKGPKARVLHTSGLTIQSHSLPFQYRLLELIVNPTIAFLLLTVGLIGLGLEILAPGHILPGITGAIGLILGLYGSFQLPITAAGVLLLVLAIALLVLEVKTGSGWFAAGGVASLSASGLLLYDTGSSAYAISPVAVIGTALVLGVIVAFLVRKIALARTLPVKTGWEELVGASGDVRVALDPIGQIFIHGALWRAQGPDDGQIAVGDRVRVESVDGLTLKVRSLADSSPEAKEGAD